MKIKRRTLITLAIELLVVVLIVYGVNLWRTRDAASGMAPALSGITIQGEAVDLSALRGQTVLVHFWATWCPICSFEEGSIQSISEETTTITVALSSGSDMEILTYLAENDLTFATLNDHDGLISNHWGVAGVPMSFIIDREGMIRFSELGYTSGPGLRLRLWLADNF